MAPQSKQYLNNIWILETSSAYRHEVIRYLDLIRTTSAGKTLFHYINQRPQWMLIMPFHPTAKDPMNAYAYPKQGSEADSYAKYAFMMTPFKLPNDVTIEIPTGVGTGKGSMVYVDYHPATWRQRIKNTGGIAPGSGPGEVLFHEMVHGYRMQCGLMRDDKVAGHPQMDNIEEFYAILAANVYRSDRGFTALRTDHRGFERLKSTDSYPEVFYETFKKQIDDWFDRQHPFCLDMARVPAKFNPFRQAAIARGFMTAPLTPMRL
jgi:hypothetical protein